MSSNKPHINTSFSNLSATVIAIWQRILRASTESNEIQVWQKADCYSNIYWQAYDPKTGESTSLSSEAEMQIWIEQHYYQSNYFNP